MKLTSLTFFFYLSVTVYPQKQPPYGYGGYPQMYPVHPYHGSQYGPYNY